MNSVATAIKNRGSVAGNFNTSINGRLYFVKSPQDPTYPYVVFSLVGPEHIEYYFGFSSDSGQAIEDVVVQFNVHSDTIGSSSEVGTILGYLKTQFDNCSLTISGYNSHKMKRNNVYGPFWLEDKEEWLYITEYGLIFQKS